MVIKRPSRQRHTPQYLPEVQSRVPLDKSQDLASLRTLKGVFFANPFVPEVSGGLQRNEGLDRGCRQLGKYRQQQKEPERYRVYLLHLLARYGHAGLLPDVS